MSTETGVLPPEGWRSISVRCPRRLTRKDAMSLVPASTATSTRPSSDSATAPWDCSVDAGAEAAGAVGRDRRQRAVRTAVEPVHGVAGRRVGLGVDGAAAVGHGGTGEQQGEARREGSRGAEWDLHGGASWGACGSLSEP